MRIIATFVEAASHWPSMIRGDILLRSCRLAGQTAEHHIIVREDPATVRAHADRLEVAYDALHLQTRFIDSAQVMVDRLLAKGHAYASGPRIFVPWAGAKGYSPVQRMRGRHGPFDIQIWGPHWDDGPVGPSQTLLRWSTGFDLANGPLDWALGLDQSAVRRAAALANALGFTDLAQRFDRPLVASAYAEIRGVTQLSPAQSRWTALQVKHDFTIAQGGHAANAVYAARLIGAAAQSGNLSWRYREMFARIHHAIEHGLWRDAAIPLQQLAKRCNRMRDPDALVPALLDRALWLFEGLGL